MNVWNDLSLRGDILGIVSCGLLLVLMIATMWRLFTKAGRPGWAALIPVYNLYVLVKIAKRPGWWLIWYFVPVVCLVVHIIVSLDIARAFGKKVVFGIMLWLLPFIGYPILSFGEAAYQSERSSRPHSTSKQQTAYQNILIGLVIFLILVSGAGITAAAYFHHQDDRVRDEVTSETTKFQNIAFDTRDEWDANYRLTVMYPKTDNATVDAAVHAKIDKYVDQFKALVARKPGDVPPYNLHIVGSVNYASKTAVNFSYEGSWTINGVTGNLTVNALFNRKTGKEVQTKDLFKDDGYLKTASDAARQALPSILGNNYNKTLADTGTAPIVANFDQYEIVDSKTINVIFEPGQVASEALGTVKVPLTLDSLSGEWNDATVGALFPDFIAALKAKEAADAAAAAAKAAQEQAAAAAAKQAGNFLPAHGTVDCTKAKCIALTFDDGPGPATDAILDTLERYKVPATFMVIGRQVASHTDQLKREAADGNDIGSHTWDHNDLTSLDVAGVQSEVNQTQQAVMNVLGKQPFMLRPPYGAWNQSVLHTVGMPLILWSVDPDDWKDRDADIVYQRVMSHAHANAIVLSHDLYPTTAAAYQRIIPDLISQGYTLVTVSNLEGIDPAHLPLDVYTGQY